MIRQLYHTQEHRQYTRKLDMAIKCIRDDAWLGEGYYFWYDENDAHRWGTTSKKRYGYYDVYQADIDCENILDTVFNEEHYKFWVLQIEKVAKTILKKTGEKPTLKEINEYFLDRGTWSELSGIMFQDLPTNTDLSAIKPIESKNNRQTVFVYRKRIQLVAYDKTIISNFTHKLTMPC